MEIEQIPFSAFQSLTSCTHALRKPQNDGCGWYATTDRRVAGRIYFDADEEQFRVTVLNFVRAGWDVEESSQRFASFDEAEAAVIRLMTAHLGQPVTLVDVPFRLRFGKGQSRNAPR